MKVFMKESLRISIHAPPRGATTWTAAGTLRRSFQFTPLREGRPPPESLYIAGTYFNSRPSARGDCRLLSVLVASRISIHAPPRGATEEFERRDPAAFISIHAPPRGATVLMSAMEQSLTFQFTPLREGRPPSDRWG